MRRHTIHGILSSASCFFRMQYKHQILLLSLLCTYIRIHQMAGMSGARCVWRRTAKFLMLTKRNRIMWANGKCVRQNVDGGSDYAQLRFVRCTKRLLLKTILWMDGWMNGCVILIRCSRINARISYANLLPNQTIYEYRCATAQLCNCV